MNRRGDLGSGILFFAFFLMAIIIGGGLVGGVFAFYGKGYDFRQAEAQIMLGKINECYLNNKNIILKEDFIVKEFYELCGIDEGVINDGNHFVLIKDVKNNREIALGVNDFRNRCFFVGAENNLKFPQCVKNVIGDIEITAGSNQGTRSVAI
jgi:hypothetical protein